MPELPEVETIRRQLAPLVEGRTLARLHIADPRWCLPLAPEAVVDAVAGTARRAPGAARQVPDLGARRRRLPAHAPAHDRDPALRPALRHAVRARALRPRRRPRPALLRPAALRHRRACDRRPARAMRSWPPGWGSSRSRASSPAPRCSAWRAAGAPRSRRSCSTSGGSPGVGNIYADEALFRARIHPLRPAGRLTRAQWEALAAGGPRRARRRSRGGRGDDRRLPRRRRRPRLLPGRVPRPPPPGRAVPGVRDAGGQARGRRARDLRVRALPAAAEAAPPAGGGEAVSQLARSAARRPARSAATSSREAAEHLALDDDLREADHPRLLDQLGASGRVLCQIDLLVAQAAARRAGPWRGRRRSRARSSRR